MRLWLHGLRPGHHIEKQWGNDYITGEIILFSWYCTHLKCQGTLHVPGFGRAI